MASPPQQQQHLLTQSYYDELLAENAELYDLDNVETDVGQQCTAVLDTLDELTGASSAPGDTGVTGGGAGAYTVDHLILSHPASSTGQTLRVRQLKLLSALEILDGCVGTDGSVRLDTDTGDDDAMASLGLVRAECLGGGISSSISSGSPVGSAGSAEVNSNEAGPNEVGPAGSSEENSAGSSGGPNDDGSNDDDNLEIGSSESGNPNTDGIGRSSYRALVTLQTTASMYTLMSLLGVVPLSTLSSPSNDGAASEGQEGREGREGHQGGQEDHEGREGREVQEGREERDQRETILAAVCQTLIAILSPPSGSWIRAIQSSGGGSAGSDTAAAAAAAAAAAVAGDSNSNGSDATTSASGAATTATNTATAVDDVNAPSAAEAEAEAAMQTAIASALSSPVQLLRLVRKVKSDLRDSFVAFERLVGLMERYASELSRLVVDGSGSDSGASSGGDHDGGNAKRLEDVCGILTQLAQLATAACGGCEKNKVAFVRAGKKKKGDGIGSSACSSAGASNGRDGSGGIAVVVSTLSLLSDQTQHQRDGTAAKDITAPLTAYCMLLAVLCRFDDFRSPSATTNAGAGGGALPTPDMTVSSAHDHVLEFHRQGVVPVLHAVTTLALDGNDGNDGTGGSGNAELTSAALAATRTLAVNDEIVQALVAVGVLRSARLALAAGIVADGDEEDVKGKVRQRRTLTSASLGLIRNLCGNDEIKTNLCLGTADGNAETTTVLPSILQAMRSYQSDAAVQEHGCATLAAMALRKPANAQRIVEEGGPMEVLTAMRRHPTVVPVQRQGCLAVRNISSRLIKIAEAEQNGDSTGTSNADGTSIPIEVREAFLDLGAESVLRDIAGKHQGSVDEAYAALRDLGCTVSMVRYDTDENGQANGGSGTRGVTMFGEVKSKFNPVFEESNELGAAVDRL